MLSFSIGHVLTTQHQGKPSEPFSVSSRAADRIGPGIPEAYQLLSGRARMRSLNHKPAPWALGSAAVLHTIP